MAVLTQKDKKLARLAGAGGDFLLFWGQGNGRVPHNVLLIVVGHGTLLHLSEHSPPLLSAVYKPLSKHLISVLGQDKRYALKLIQQYRIVEDEHPQRGPWK